MSQENSYNTLHEAVENSEEDQAVVDLGFNRGYKVISEDQW